MAEGSGLEPHSRKGANCLAGSPGAPVQFTFLKLNFHELKSRREFYVDTTSFRLSESWDSNPDPQICNLKYLFFAQREKLVVMTGVEPV